MADSAAQLDVDLASRCASGHQEAARELFRRYQGRVQATLFRIFGSNVDMDDLLQDVFVQVFQSLPSFRGDAQLATWIHRIAVRVAYRSLRQKRRALPTDPLVEVDSHRPGPDSDYLAREGVRRFYAALDDLSPGARIAFVLFELEGASIKDVAERLDIAPTTAKLRVWRARKSLTRKAKADPVLAEFFAREPTAEESS